MMTKKKAVKELSKADKATLKEYASLTGEGSFKPLFQFNELDPLDQMAVLDNIYSCLNDFFVKQGKKRILDKLQWNEMFGADSEDVLNFSYKWTMSAGSVYAMLKQVKEAKK